jgi:AcrB/AcrD/AcrF family
MGVELEEGGNQCDPSLALLDYFLDLRGSFERRKEGGHLSRNGISDGEPPADSLPHANCTNQVFLDEALALGEGSEQRAPMGSAVMGGLITSTLLTPFVVPVVYTLLDDFSNRVRRGRSSRPRVVHAGPAVRDPEPVAAD